MTEKPKSRSELRRLAIMRGEPMPDFRNDTESQVTKEVFQKHGISEPCPICLDRHVPQATWRDQERRCLDNPKQACGCCDGCRDQEKCKQGEAREGSSD